MVGEAPGNDEDKEGRPFIGASGRVLRGVLIPASGIPEEDIYITNVCKCRPPANRQPNMSEIKKCTSMRLVKEIEKLKPKLIVAVGATATRFFVGRAITSVAGQWIWNEGYKCWIVPMYHPSMVVRGLIRSEVLLVLWKELGRVYLDGKADTTDRVEQPLEKYNST